jgi:SnoaL-like polyketide cyclase
MQTFAGTGEMIYNRASFPSDDAIRGEGRLCGKHVGEFLGFAPTNRDVELPYVTFYRFDDAGKLASERVVMNLAPLRAGG